MALLGGPAVEHLIAVCGDIGCMLFGDRMDPLFPKLGEMSMTLTRTSVMRLDTQRTEGKEPTVTH